MAAKVKYQSFQFAAPSIRRGRFFAILLFLRKPGAAHKRTAQPFLLDEVNDIVLLVKGVGLYFIQYLDYIVEEVMRVVEQIAERV